ncbi:hypothetical protein EU805_15950 [Salipiger sp. IMCC34102]|uniref:hypothetical protein n=1 Tax=Salipiger sp. IMCC34102 TaxID=2510647 RepID=UPI00101C5CED|nr:hypothetical protein [Salipiger sp. IMCC34102]RYH00947.1 hypothetical protein EU805_15950 [Salipiger sp. IMCC34102]
MTGGAIPLDRLMGRLSAELGTLEAIGGRVEVLVGDLVGQSGRAVPTDLQDLDLLVQSLRDLASFTQALSRSVPDTSVDATTGIAMLKLRRLRDALSGAAPETGQADHGDILF